MSAQNETPKKTVSEDFTPDLSEDPIVLGLKQLYDSVLEEAVPNDFMALLGQIDATLAQQKDAATQHGDPAGGQSS